jgi:vacuolar-type H+-ATPase subunit E/Vma4
MKTLKEAVEYVYNYIKDYEKNNEEILDQEALYDMMEEMLLEAVDEVLSDDDMKTRVSSKDDSYLDKILNERLGENYPALLQEMTNDILNEYVLDE